MAQLPRLDLVADEVNAGAAGLVDAWFEAWREPDLTVCEKTLGRIAVPDVRFRDRFSLTTVLLLNARSCVLGRP